MMPPGVEPKFQQLFISLEYYFFTLNCFWGCFTLATDVHWCFGFETLVVILIK